MIDDSMYGTRNKRGDYIPSRHVKKPPIIVWPPQPMNLLKWFFGYEGYLWPWNAIYFTTTLLLWAYLVPGPELTATLSPGWIAIAFVRNCILALIFYGILHLHLYVARNQGTSFKHNSRWPDKPNSAFLFSNQTLDNLIWTFAAGVPIWTTYEVLLLWSAANGFMPVIYSGMSPVYFVALLLLIPVWRDIHFFVIHRAIHWPPLYESVHKIHHNNVNPGPWSGLAMHPIEHLLYFSNVLIFFVVPFHPLHALFMLYHTALVPARVHLGFEKIVLPDDILVDANEYSHYLHHKYFECNYADGMLPLDQWFGTFHDGSPESERRMMERFKKRKERLNPAAKI